MERSSKHEDLKVFLGKWTARGTSFGGTDQSGSNPKANGQIWLSTHEAYWHTGNYFLIQDERADIQGSRFDTIFILGVDEQGEYFARTFENHGFSRDYVVTHEGNTWTFTGEWERAIYQFEDQGRRQVVTWEWKQDGKWMPLCDRSAERVD